MCVVVSLSWHDFFCVGVEVPGGEKWVLVVSKLTTKYVEMGSNGRSRLGREVGGGRGSMPRDANLGV